MSTAWSSEQIAESRAYHARRDAALRETREARRRRCLDTARRAIQEDLGPIEKIFRKIADVEIDLTTPQERENVFVGYQLHHLYNAFENIFQAVDQAFENHLDGLESRHAQLLQRMRLDLSPLRPAVIDADAHEKLDELRRFRHVFRSLYGVELDPQRMVIALRKAQELRAIWRAQIDAFLSFLDTVQ